MRFTLRQIEVFLAVARHESVSRAAEELRMSQSAASGALGELERQFDVQLFDRIGKRLRLASLGRDLRARAESLYDQAKAMERALAEPKTLGALTVGATLTIGNYLAPRLLARFAEEHEGSRVTLTLGNTRDIAHRVENFEIDVGLVEGELINESLVATPWYRDELVVFCAPEHPWARLMGWCGPTPPGSGHAEAPRESRRRGGRGRRGRPLEDVDLVRGAWIVREAGSGTRQTFERAMSGLLPHLDLALELEHNEAIKGAVAAGLGVGCLSKITLEQEFARGTLVPCAVACRNFEREFYCVVHERKYMTTALQDWLELCRHYRDDRRG